jgi:hypothetical protein
MTKRHRVLVGIVLALVLVLLLPAWISQSYTQCVEHAGQQPTAQQTEKGEMALQGPRYSGVMLQIHCAGEFAEHNAHSITGLATVLLAFVTAGLVWLGYEQSVTTRAQLRAYIFVEHANIVDGATPASRPLISRMEGCATCKVAPQERQD